MSERVQMEQAQVRPAETRSDSWFSRRPLATLGRVALWTSFGGTIAGLGGTIALTIINGTPSRDIVTATLLFLSTTILIATRMRALQALAALLELYSLKILFTEPFVVESLANPKGPNGGYGHFIGDVLILADALIAFAATIGIVTRGLSRKVEGSQKTPRWFLLVVNGVVGLVIGASFIGALAQPIVLAAPTLTYTNGVPTVHLTPSNFSISAVTITKGSKLLLVDDTTEQHVLANGVWQQDTPVQKQEPGAPRVSNLSLSGNSATLGPFTIAGTYHLLCLLHRGMGLTINVQ